MPRWIKAHIDQRGPESLGLRRGSSPLCVIVLTGDRRLGGPAPSLRVSGNELDAPVLPRGNAAGCVGRSRWRRRAGQGPAVAFLRPGFFAVEEPYAAISRGVEEERATSDRSLRGLASGGAIRQKSCSGGRSTHRLSE